MVLCTYILFWCSSVQKHVGRDNRSVSYIVEILMNKVISQCVLVKLQTSTNNATTSHVSVCPYNFSFLHYCVTYLPPIFITPSPKKKDHFKIFFKKMKTAYQEKPHPENVVSPTSQDAYSNR